MQLQTLYAIVALLGAALAVPSRGLESLDGNADPILKAPRAVESPPPGGGPYPGVCRHTSVHLLTCRPAWTLIVLSDMQSWWR